MIKINFILITICIFLNSCTSGLQIAAQHYEAAPICCNNLNEFKYIPVSYDEGETYSINEKSTAFNFDNFKSFFLPLQLPKYEKSYAINIRSLRIGPSLRNSYIFLPKIIFLNDKFEITRIVESSDFKFHKTTLFENPPSDYILESNVPVTNDNAMDKYMVIYTSPKTDTKKSTVEAIEVAGVWFPIVAVIPTGRMQNIEIPYAPVGKLKITLESTN